MEMHRGCLSGCFLLRDPSPPLERRIHALFRTATGASRYNQVKIAWAPPVQLFHLFSHILLFFCGPFHALCHISVFALGNTDLSYCSVSFLGDIDVIPLSCGEKAEDNPLWSLKWCLKVSRPISDARCVQGPAGNWRCRFAWVWEYCLWHFCPLYRSHFSSFCHLNSLDFLMMAWTIGQPSSSPAVFKTQVNLQVSSVRKHWEWVRRSSPFVSLSSMCLPFSRALSAVHWKPRWAPSSYLSKIPTCGISPCTGWSN